MQQPEELLPPDVLARAGLRGGEYAWPVSDLPTVIEAARAADLVNIGGQLQLRLPDGGTCECYWIEVDTCKALPDELPWRERVSLAAEAAHSQLEQLQHRYDFIAEARSAFAKHLEAFEAAGGKLADALCFVWYVQAEGSASKVS